ncbi:MAG: F0F1 ATP synthase subunit B' [Hyphomicrobiales bacterium]|nr:hypothetical protein [Rickettsiales bacterium]MCP5362128.1 F0F1 ATP synthase subunit B' [Hyphomicrobiales bacterium]
MPQLDYTTFASQLFWLAISFTVLYLFMQRYVLPRMTSVLQGRRERIANDLEKAEQLKQEAEALNADYISSINKVRGEANALIAKAVADSKDNAEARFSKLEKELSEKAQKAEKDLITARKKVVEEISDVASALARDIVKQVADLKVSAKDADKVVQQLAKKA